VASGVLAGVAGPDGAPACTYASAVVGADAVTVCWLGDSRVYWLAAGPGDVPEGNPAGPDATQQDAERTDTGAGSERTDTGAGFGGLVLPVGAYVVKDGQVRWVSAVDMTIAVLASLSLVRVLARTWRRSRRR